MESLTIEWTFHHVGQVVLGQDDKLIFPRTENKPGVY
jgi:hypothetical protein